MLSKKGPESSSISQVTGGRRTRTVSTGITSSWIMYSCPDPVFRECGEQFPIRTLFDPECASPPLRSRKEDGAYQLCLSIDLLQEQQQFPKTWRGSMVEREDMLTDIIGARMCFGYMATNHYTRYGATPARTSHYLTRLNLSPSRWPSGPARYASSSFILPLSCSVVVKMVYTLPITFFIARIQH